MRVVYCHACGAVSTNTFGEHDVCTNCGGRAERMRYHRPWQSYLSGALLFGTAAILVWGPITDGLFRGALFIAAFVVAFFLANWGLTVTRKRVLKEIAQRKASSEGKG